MQKNIYNHIFKKELNKIKAESRYRYFNELKRFNTSYPFANWVVNGNEKKVIIWCSNDYLGMSQNNHIINAAKESLSHYGTSSGGTRNISGNHQPIVNLEREIALLHKKERALVFTSGYVANESTISGILNLFKDCIVFSDKKNHASIISGIKKVNNEKYIFNHNDMNELENKLRELPLDRPKLIIFESVYSMDGSVGDVKNIVKLAQKYNCLTYIDEVHAVGMYGKNGGGFTEVFGLQNKIDIIQGTLGKAFGNIGGYIASSDLICDYIRSTASGFIFTTSIPPAIANSSLHAIKYLRHSSKERITQKKNVDFLKNKLRENNINFLENNSHIIPVMINDAYICKEISFLLLEDFGHYIQPINYPTVDRGSERLRITPGPLHTEEMMLELVKSLKICIERVFDQNYKRANV